MFLNIFLHIKIKNLSAKKLYVVFLLVMYTCLVVGAWFGKIRFIFKFLNVCRLGPPVVK